MSEKIVVVYPKASAASRALVCKAAAAHNRDVEFYSSAEEAAPHLQDAEVIFARDGELISFAPSLRWFCSTSAGINAILDSDLLLGRDLLLSNASGAYGISIAEHIIMVSLMLMRRMPEYQGYIRQKKWQQDLEQRSLYGSRILVLGTGDLGATFASRARAFAPSCIIGFNRTGHDVPGFDRTFAMDQLDAQLPQTDLLVMCLPQTPATIHVLNEQRIALLPPQALVVNVGRGTAIEQAALVNALNSGKIAGAALDVAETEPVPENDPLWTAKNLILTPHCAGNDTLPVTRERNMAMFAEDLQNYLEGRPLRYAVNRKAGY